MIKLYLGFETKNVIRILSYETLTMEKPVSPL